MDPSTMATTMSNSQTNASDQLMLKSKLQSPRDEPKVAFASVSVEEDKPSDLLQVLFDCAVAGGAAGVFVEAVLYPIDTIKTRLQAARVGGKINFNGLYSGLVGNLAGVLPSSAIFLGVYEPVKQKLLKTFPENLSAFAHLVIKQRMQTGQFASAPDAVRLIVCKEGFKGLYVGYGSFLLRDLPFDAIQFCIYEQLLLGYKLAARRNLNSTENAIVGALAGAITGSITTPLDVIKTRLMVQGSSNQYKGICDCVRTIVKEEGIPTLFKGMGPRVLWIGIGGSIFFGVLEKTKEVLSQGHSNSQDSSSFKLD